MAAERGVRVYTVGFGSPGLTQVMIDGEQMEVGFDEEALQAVAQATRAAYFHASTADDLNHVYRTLGGKVVVEKKAREVTALLTGLGAILLLGSGALSLAWSNRFA
jgi:Ca-activated chloride channel family protein